MEPASRRIGGKNKDVLERVTHRALSITKEASPTTYSKVGELITYTIVATNTGNVTLSNVSVEDKPALEGFSCSPSIPATLAPGKSITCTGKHTVTQADLEAGKLSDTACVSATGASEQCASVELIGPPNLTITKTADTGGTPSTVAAAGNPIGFTITVASTGASPATNVSMNDPLPAGSGIAWSIDSQSGGGNCSISGSPPSQTLTCAKASMPVNESFSVHVSSPTTSGSAGTYNNTATASATKVPAVQASAHITVYGPCTLGYPTGSLPALASVV